MASRCRVIAVIPTLNEAGAIGPTIAALPGTVVDVVVVVDGGSADGTVAEARAAGAEALIEHRPGYGRACATGADRAAALGAEIVLFLDGDGADPAEEAGRLIGPLIAGQADFVLASRTQGPRAACAMGPASDPRRSPDRLAGRRRRRCALHRYVSIPRHWPRPARGARDAGNDLWVEPRNADPRRRRRASHPRGASAVPPAPRRPLEGRRHARQHAEGQHPHSCHPAAHRLCAATRRTDMTPARPSRAAGVPPIAEARDWRAPSVFRP